MFHKKPLLLRFPHGLAKLVTARSLRLKPKLSSGEAARHWAKASRRTFLKKGLPRGAQIIIMNKEKHFDITALKQRAFSTASFSADVSSRKTRPRESCEKHAVGRRKEGEGIKMKKVTAIICCLLLVLACAACGEPEPEEPLDGEGEMAPNPFVDCETAEQAAAIAGFEFNVPEHIKGSGQGMLRASESLQLYEVIYQSGDGEICLRKGLGAEDISGVYLELPEEEDLRIGTKAVTIKGDGESDILTTWTEGDYSYSVYASEGLDRDTLVDLVAGLN